MTFRENIDKDIKESYEKTHSCSYWDVFISNFEKLIDETKEKINVSDTQAFNLGVESLAKKLKEELSK